MSPSFICSADKNKSQGGGEETSDIQKQTQDKNVSALVASISKLQEEKKQLQKEKDELQEKLAAKSATKGRVCSTYCHPSEWKM